jgi:hypothetical protein
MNINKTKIGMIFSVLIVFSGILYGLYTYLIYPTLVPSYGASERFLLSPQNNYTTTFPLYSSDGLYVTIEANTTIEVFFNNTSVCNCSIYEVYIKENTELSVSLQSDHFVEGRIRFRQKIPNENIIYAYLIPSIGLGFFLILLYVSYREKKT